MSMQNSNSNLLKSRQFHRTKSQGGKTMIYLKMQRVLRVLLGFFLLSIVVCHSVYAGTEDKHSYLLEEDLVYGKGNDYELKLDLARPAREKRPIPALVFIHSGSWYTGSRTYFHTGIKEAAKRGYVAVSIAYRHARLDKNGKVINAFPAQIYDVKCAVRWLRANAAKYSIDPDRIGTAGHGAGGHLALMLGLTTPSDGLEGECGDLKYSSRVQAVVSLVGVTDFISWYHWGKYWPKINFLEGSPKNVPEVYKKASPVTYVRKNAPPILSIYGDLSPYVPTSQAELLDSMMKEKGASHTLILKKNTGHRVHELVDFSKDNPIWNFFDEHLK